ncbi:MAG: serine/threonine protein kinase, partial [Okeania sp. SIO2H7]|nr:serine/threonine protein kinase [Okeania sp. SIO2H7]
QKAVAVGMAIGAMVGAAVGLGNKLAFSSEIAPQESVATAKCQGLEVKSDRFYFLADSAFFAPDTAKEKCQSLVESGEKEAGVFWTSNYPNIHSSGVYKVYAGVFGDRSSCQKALVEFSQKNPDAYCGFANKKLAGDS